MALNPYSSRREVLLLGPFQLRSLGCRYTSCQQNCVLHPGHPSCKAGVFNSFPRLPVFLMSINEDNRMGKTRDLFKKIRDTKGTFHAKMGSIKDRNGMDLTEAEILKKRWQEYTEQKRS